MATVAALWRHPIKSHGRQRIPAADLAPGGSLPWDRTWAVAHEDSAFDPANPAWVSYHAWNRGSQAPALAGFWAELDESAARVTLTHARHGKMTFCPDDPAQAQAFVDWVRPLVPANRPQPRSIARAPGRAMTDTDYPSVSLLNLASHAAVAAATRPDLEPERWRANIWLDGLTPWEETGWIGRRLRVGTALLEVREPIVRCLHTAASPVTGDRDADTLGALDRLTGARDCGVYAVVVEGGHIREGCEAVLWN